jgi:hypothetical protein
MSQDLGQIANDILNSQCAKLVVLYLANHVAVTTLRAKARMSYLNNMNPDYYPSHFSEFRKIKDCFKRRLLRPKTFFYSAIATVSELYVYSTLKNQ